jgi:hypothetical protein
VYRRQEEVQRGWGVAQGGCMLGDWVRQEHLQQVGHVDVSMQTLGVKRRLGHRS